MFVLNNLPEYTIIKDHLQKAGFPTADADSLYMFLTLISVSGKLTAQAEQFFAGFDLSRGRFMALSQLSLQGPDGLHPSELAQRIGVTRATITGLLDGLEREDLIKRFHSDADRRSVTACLTEKGTGLLKQIFPLRLKQVQKIFSTLTGSEKKTLTELLQKLDKNIEHNSYSQHHEHTNKTV